MRKSAIISSWILLISSSMVQAAPAAPGEGIPEYVFWQIGNFAVFVLLMYWILRTRVPEFFRAKREAFLAHEQKARKQKEDALRAKQEVQSQMQRLVSGKDQGLKNAAHEGQLFADKMSQEAKALALRLEQELKRTEAVEMEKVAYSVRSLLIERSVDKARSTIKKDLVEADDKRLQSEFVEKIQVVS